MIDVHCHMLPGVDDGSKNVMARAQYRLNDGIMMAVRLMAFMRERNMTVEQMDMYF